MDWIPLRRVLKRSGRGEMIVSYSGLILCLRGSGHVIVYQIASRGKRRKDVSSMHA